jgi:Pectinacetylesterase
VRARRPYAFWLRRGDPRKLVVFFQGGGACADAESCRLGSGFDDTVTTDDDPGLSGGGLLALDDARNPLGDWSFVFVPYCSGDLQTGDVRTDYGDVVIGHRGWQNAKAALDRALRAFPRPETVLVTGCSAGSMGAAFHAETILRRYPNARVAEISDSGADLLPRAYALPWRANAHFPSFLQVGNAPWTQEQFVRRLARAYPDAAFARFNHVRDPELTALYLRFGGDAATFEPTLREVERWLKRIPNYRSYLACGRFHCAFDDESFFTTETGGVRLRDWVQDLAAGRDVDCPECGIRRSGR